MESRTVIDMFKLFIFGDLYFKLKNLNVICTFYKLVDFFHCLVFGKSSTSQIRQPLPGMLRKKDSISLFLTFDKLVIKHILRILETFR